MVLISLSSKLLSKYDEYSLVSKLYITIWLCPSTIFDVFFATFFELLLNTAIELSFNMSTSC